MTRSLSLAAVLLLSGCSMMLDTGSLAKPEVPGAPAGLAAAGGNAKATLTWDAVGGDVGHYHVFRGPSATALAKVGETTGTTPSFVATGLTNGTTYFFAIAAIDSGGNASPLSDTVSATPQLPDTTPPTVHLAGPLDGATSVSLDAALVVSFSETMDPGTVTVSTTPSLVLGPPTWNADNTEVMFEPAFFNSLVAETNYAVQVTGADPAGNPTTAAFHFRTIGVPPTLDATTPSLDAASVPTGAAIQLVFSEPMNTGSVQLAFGSSPGIGCSWAWTDGNTTATCTHAAFPASTHYVVTVGTGAQDANGTAMAAEATFGFTTASAPDTTPPTVSAYTPANATNGIARSTTISVTFSEAVDKVSAQAAFSVVSPTNFNGGSFSWSGDGLTMTYSPPSSFSYGATVQWRVNTAVKDLAGNYMVAQVDRYFYVINSGTTVLYSQAAEDGYIYSGSGYVGASQSYMFAGDYSDNGSYYRGFLSFNFNVGSPNAIPSNATAITAATLYVYQFGSANTPYSVLGNVLADSVYYGTTLDAADLTTPTLTYLGRTCTFTPVFQCYLATLNDTYTLSTSPTDDTYKSVTVTGKVARDLANRAARNSRSQFRIRFATNYVADSTIRYTQFYTGNASSNRPYLYVTYEYP